VSASYPNSSPWTNEQTIYCDFFVLRCPRCRDPTENGSFNSCLLCKNCHDTQVTNQEEEATSLSFIPLQASVARCTTLGLLVSSQSQPGATCTCLIPSITNACKYISKNIGLKLNCKPLYAVNRSRNRAPIRTQNAWHV
jgi:hypothetical protein